MQIESALAGALKTFRDGHSQVYSHRNNIRLNFAISKTWQATGKKQCDILCSPDDSPSRLRDVMLASALLAVDLVRVQSEAAMAGALEATQRVVAVVLAAAVVLSALVHVDVVCCGEARAVDRGIGCELGRRKSW